MIQALLFFTLLTSPSSKADNSPKTMEAISSEMAKALVSLKKKAGWDEFIANHKDLFANVNEENPAPFLAVSDLVVKVDKDEYRVGMGTRSIWIAATPKVVVQVVNNPHTLMPLYGLDKPADIYPVNADGSFDARVYKLVPGIETQDYTLHYAGNWEGEVWIQEASQVKDEKGFALRENIKIVEPSGHGALFREVSLLYPRRWWVKLMHGLAQNVFKKELGKMNKALKYCAEKVQGGTAMSDDLAKACYKESQN